MLRGVRLSPQGRSCGSLGEISGGVPAFASLCFVLLAGLCFASAATAHDRIRIAAQKTGTLAWELDIIKAHGLDKAADLDIEVVELASTEAGKIALRSGSA